MYHLTTTSPFYEERAEHGQLRKGDGEFEQGEEYEQSKENGQGERNFEVENEEELYRPCDEDLIDIKDDIKDIRAIFSSDEDED